MFALVVYGQLILEQAELTGLDPQATGLDARQTGLDPQLPGLDPRLLDEIFAVLVRDFAQHATDLHGKTATTDEQAAWALAQVLRPVADEARTAAVWEQVLALVGAYEMRP